MMQEILAKYVIDCIFLINEYCWKVKKNCVH